MRRFRLGTRGSPLALAQARETASRLAVAFGWTDGELEERIEIVVIKTTGDKITDRPLADAGGKGLFIKELEEALGGGRVDFAVHSMKDVPGILEGRFEIAAALPREDARDALLGAPSIDALPKGARVGTTSPRRRSQLLWARPDLDVVLFRGNVQTRIDKLARGEADATMLAVAGLNRLGLTPPFVPLDAGTFVPAAAQGIVGLEIRRDDAEVRELLSAINDQQASIALTAERGCLAELDGSCRSSIGIHAAPNGDGTYAMAAVVFSLDGRDRRSVQIHIPNDIAGADLASREAGAALKAEAAHLLN